MNYLFIGDLIVSLFSFLNAQKQSPVTSKNLRGIKKNMLLVIAKKDIKEFFVMNVKINMEK